MRRSTPAARKARRWRPTSTEHRRCGRPPPEDRWRPPASSNRVDFRGTPQSTTPSLRRPSPAGPSTAGEAPVANTRLGVAVSQLVPCNRNGFEAWELYGARDAVDRRLVTTDGGYQPPGSGSTYRQHDSLAGGAVMPTMTVDIHCWLAVSLGKLTRWAEGALAKALIDGGGQARLGRQRVVALDVGPGESEEALPVDAHAGHQPWTISSSAGGVRPTARRTAVGLGQARDQGNVRVPPTCRRWPAASSACGHRVAVLGGVDGCGECAGPRYRAAHTCGSWRAAGSKDRTS